MSMRMQSHMRVLDNRLPRIRRQFGPAVNDAINGGIAAFVRVADPNTPVNRGFLRGDKTIKHASGNRHEGDVTYNRSYGVYVHEGTVRVGARPWARNAAGVVMPQYMANMRALRFW